MKFNDSRDLVRSRSWSESETSVPENIQPSTRRTVPREVSWFVFGLMASVTFVGILSELVPSGVLPEIATGLHISETRVGLMVGVYAMASALSTIPVVSATLAMNRKRLLLSLLAGFAVSNLVVGISSSYTVITSFRILGGICAGVMWPMIAAYGARLAPENRSGRAITVIMSGNTIGISLGLPVMAMIGTTLGWRWVFLILGVIVAVIAGLSYIFLPSVEGEKLNRSNSPFAMLTRPGLLILLFLTFLSVAAHYGIYTYIALLVERIGFAGGRSLALLLFGIGSIVSVVISAKFIDAHLRPLIVSMLALGGLSMVLFLLFRGMPVVSHSAFFLWGLAFGPMVTGYQTAVIRQVDSAPDVATSMQSSVFNFSIMIASWIGGILMSGLGDAGINAIVHLSLGCYVLATTIAFLSKRTLRSAVDGSSAPVFETSDEVHERAGVAGMK